ncbi:MAG: hypothetical protein LBR22_03815 [Desulfovibrio sp.]|nr:hypothetical protein [Desulfovibrio sp.]
MDSWQLLDRLPEALDRVRPLSSRQAKELPEDVAALSRLLTTERDRMGLSYWSSPGLISAYLHYFLPWNLVRLLGVLGGLPLPPVGTGDMAIVDVGSGPLTVPLALWLAFPELRTVRMHVHAMDKSIQPLKMGKALLAEMSRLAGVPVWPVHLTKSPILHRFGLGRLSGDMPPVWLVAFGNVLNELPGGAGQVLPQLQGMLHAGSAGRTPAAFFMEPGTRLGGKSIMELRSIALAEGWQARHPCPHNGECPLVRRGGSPWCHFVVDAPKVPAHLADLSVRAGLGKASLSLSMLLLGESLAGRGDGLPARVLSAPFATAANPRARYACSAKGLLLLGDAGDVGQGEQVLVQVPASPRLDPRSRAICLPRFLEGNKAGR